MNAHTKSMFVRLILPAALAAGMTAALPATASTYSLTYQDVTFDIQDVDSNTLSLSISNATNASGDWTGVGFIRAFEIGDIGDVTNPVVTGPGSFAWNDGELNADGCTGGTQDHNCLQSTPVALTDSMTWTIDYTGTLAIAAAGPHLKVNFLTNAADENKTGSNLSQSVPSVGQVPLPGTLGLLGLGLAAIGVTRRKHA